MYIDAKLIGDFIHLSKKNKNGKREVSKHSPPYVYYYQDDNGRYKSIHGDRLHRRQYGDRKTFKSKLDKDIKKGKLIFESDVDPVIRFLEQRFPTNDYPDLNICVLDIEVDKDPTKGWSGVNNPYAIINAVTVRLKWLNDTITLAVPPPGMSVDEGYELLRQQDHEDGFGALTEGVYLVDTEEELLRGFLQLIEDADVLTGWNSTFFDIPYLVHRLRIVLGGETVDKVKDEDGENIPFSPSAESKPHLRQLGLFGALPRMRFVEHYGKPEKTFDISGRLHLDYMELYQKFTFEELHQYTLDFVLQKEIKQSKVQLVDSLDKVYRQKFRTFIAYNIQDVNGLSVLDDKKKMIDLANNMAHSAGVTLEKTLGSVAIIEAAVLKKLHNQGMVAFNKPEVGEKSVIPGAFVVKPIGGLYDWVWSIDINSLYPSIIRALNISPEVVVGQFDLTRTEEKYWALYKKYGGGKPGNSEQKERTINAKVWAEFTGVLEYHMIIDETEDVLRLEVEDTGEFVEAPAREWKRVLRENNWTVSANGTVLDLNREGIITQCMSEWFAERKEFQGKKKAAAKAQETEKDPEILKKLKDDENYCDMIQQVKKIFLNSTYGAYLNQHFRFFDPRLGRSVTLSGRCITKHMIKKASEATTGNYDFDRDAIVYGDSVAGDSEIIIEGGHRKKIEELFVTCNDIIGTKEYDFPNVKVLTYDPETNKSCYRKVKYIMRHKTNKKIFRVSINNLNYIDVTEDHSLMGYLNTNKIRKGEYFLTEVKPQDIGKRSNSLIHLKTIPRSVITSKGYDPLIYELFGYILGDGSVGKKNEGIHLSVGKEDIPEVTEKLLQPLIDKKLATSFHTRVNGHDMRICGVSIFNLAKEALYENGYKDIPSWMKYETEENICSFVKGYFSADGTVVGNTIRATSINEEYMKGIRELLFYCGISSNYFTENNTNNYNGKDSGTYSKHLVVKDRNTFKTKIGFILNRKKSKIKPMGITKRNVSNYDFDLFTPQEVKVIEFEDYVYDIEVEDTHTFFANNILVHNTDSAYCTLKKYIHDNNVVPTVKSVAEIADKFANQVNDSFPEFMDNEFLTGIERGAVIRAGREVVADSGLFADDKKKRYALHVVDDEGKQFNKDGTPLSKMKIMGMETRRSDTPKFVQDFLEQILAMVVKERREYSEVFEVVSEFREEFRKRDAWKRGSPCRVSKLTFNAARISEYEDLLEEGYVNLRKPSTHFSVVAANNTNRLMQVNHEHQWDVIHDGDKIEVLELLDNRYHVKSVAIRAGEVYVPGWFQELPFDNMAHEYKLIDKKLHNTVGEVMGWKFEPIMDYRDDVFVEEEFI